MHTIKKLAFGISSALLKKLGHKAAKPPLRLTKARALLAKRQAMHKMPNVHMLLMTAHAAHKRTEKTPGKNTERAAEPAIVLTAAERAERRKALCLLIGLNKHREGGPVDGLEFQLQQRAEW